MTNIHKTFGDTPACCGVDFSVAAGEIHALVGENGAGKSTLMKILFGLVPPDQGEIQLDGKPVTIKNSRTAIARGLGMVHQHLKVIPRLTVLENIVLGNEPTRWGILHLEDAAHKVNQLVNQLGFSLDLNKTAADLSLGEQQHLEIVKALYRKIRILILDEPTAVLSPLETGELFRLLRNLKRQGQTIIFISHKLEEVLSLADTVTVMRNGRHVQTMPAAKTDSQQLAYLMLGTEIALPENKRQTALGDEVLRLDRVSSRHQPGHQNIQQISLSIRGGEILGVAGVAGNGQSELVESITGLRSLACGRIFFKGREITHYSPGQIRQAGVTHIPEDRLMRGLVPSLSVRENLLLGHLQDKDWQNRGFWRLKQNRKECRKLIEKFNVQPQQTETPIQYFSGGNQQKVVLARELSQEHSLLIACQPARGLDLAAAAFVYQQLLAEKAAKRAVLLVSTELSEILDLSDRIIVMFRGEVIAAINAGDINQDELGRLMGGIRAPRRN